MLRWDVRLDSTRLSVAAYEIPNISATCATVSISVLLFFFVMTPIFDYGSTRRNRHAKKVRLRGVCGYKERDYCLGKVNFRI
jgi:hypothetical protein